MFVRSKPKRVLVTAAGPSMLPVLFKCSLPTFKKYAFEKNYDVKVVKLSKDDIVRNSDAQKKARWQKISIIRDTLKVSDITVWLDADVMICRYDDDIADHLGINDYQGLVLHEVPAENRINPNTGVWVMKNTEKSFRFLDMVEEIGIKKGQWADQGAVMRALGWEIGAEGTYNGARMPKVGTEFLSGVAWLPQGWNQRYCDNRPNPEAYIGVPIVKNPYAIHFTNMSADERLQVMRTAVTRRINRDITG